MFLPVGAMIAASLLVVEPVLLWLLGALFCLGLFFSFPFMRDLRKMFVGTAIIGIILSVALTNWPLRAAFWSSRPSFDQIADDVRSGKIPETPMQLGLFRIRKAEVYHNNVVCLWTDLNPSGKSGFVQCPPENPPFNLWSQASLDSSWQFIRED